MHGDGLNICHICSITHSEILVKRGLSEEYLSRLCYPFRDKAYESVVFMYVCIIQLCMCSRHLKTLH
jgi:hypothetical protein